MATRATTIDQTIITMEMAKVPVTDIIPEERATLMKVARIIAKHTTLKMTINITGTVVEEEVLTTKAGDIIRDLLK